MTNRKKFRSWLSILLLAGLGISVSPHRFLTRTSEVSGVLSPVLSNYEVIQIEPGEIERQVRTTGELRFRFNDTDFYFKLEPHNMRSPNYRAVEIGPGGVQRTIRPQPVHTFKGVLAEQEDVQGRFNLTDGGVEGVVYAPEGWVYVEPLRNYLPGAPAGELVVYRHADVKPSDAFKCGVSLPRRLERGMNRVEAQVETAIPTKYEFEIATEADYEYVEALGGPVAANREIEGILNQVEGMYQSELLLQLRISFQNVWGIADDPYTAKNTSDLLDEFIEYWNAHFADTVDYDIAHLWTDRERDDRTVGGRAVQSVVCDLRSYSYALSTRETRIPEKYVIPAHEIGHNFGATHPDEVDPPVSTCVNTAMRGGIFGGGNAQLTFCQFSRQQILEYVASNNTCLKTQGITLQPPTDLSAPAASDSRIELVWRDNSTNETGFIVQRRREGSGAWGQIETIRADSETYSDDGLFSEATYIYRVQAFNDEESSAFSNEASATTMPASVTASAWTIDTIAGRTDNDGDGGPAVRARLSFPTDVAVDGSGNVYIADWEYDRVRRVDASGTITTVAGTGEGGFSGDGGAAVDAQLFKPTAVAVDGRGNLYIADSGNERVRRVDTEGIITTVAGNGSPGFGGDGGPAVEAAVNDPRALAVDSTGNLYITQTTNSRIRRVDPSGIIATVATGFDHPRGVAVDSAGNLYIADLGNHRVQRVDSSGKITTISGTGKRGYSGDGGPAVEAELDNPHGVVVDSAGNLYISGSQQIRRVDTTGTITRIAGIVRGINNNSRGGYSGDGGPAIRAELYLPRGLALDGAENLYIADTANYRIRRVDAAGIITTIAGSGKGNFRGDGGPAVEAELHGPTGVTVDRVGNLYIADTDNHRIRRVDSKGTITTVAGSGTGGLSGDRGLAVRARLHWPHDVAVDRAGNIFIADTWNDRIRRVGAGGIITTFAGSGTPGRVGFTGDGGPARVAEIRRPRGVAVDGSGNLYIADTRNQRIRRVDRMRIITSIAGSGPLGVSGFGGDGGPAVQAQLSHPADLTADGAGNVYIADTWNNRIRRIDAKGIITTVAGIGDGTYTGGSGPAVEAALDWPSSVAVDSTGNLYIADRFHNLVRRVDTRGIITTIAGTGKRGFSGDGGPANKAQLNGPSGVAVDSFGNVYVADTENQRIRVLMPPPEPPNAPSLLTATAISFYKINLSWQDNSDDETGFVVQRRVADSPDWVEIGRTEANVTAFSDKGLEPGTAYHYRVRAFKSQVGSTFSNEALAGTPELLPPTLTRFTPTRGPVGTAVTLRGTHFLGATAVEFNAVPAARFEVVSGTSVEAVVPLEATSGPISVVTPGGTALSADHFTVIDSGIRSRLFVPIVLRALGRTPGSFFTSELTLTNRGTTTAAIRYTYRAAFGGGSGTAVDSLEASRQRVIPDAIAYLTSLGVPIGSGSAGGTLSIDFSNLSSLSAAAVTVRVSTPVEEGSGRAGLAFPGLNPDGLLTGPAFITGLRQNRQDRSNLAVQNAGIGDEESITLRVTVYSGDPEAPGSRALPDLPLPPGGFHQYNRILTEAGFDNGYAKVERVEGAAPYYAYGVINDNFNSDGSFVFPAREDSLVGSRGQTLPVIIETNDFTSELTVTNFSPAPKTVDIRFVAEAVETDEDTARFSMRLEAGEQRILPDVVEWMREQEVPGIGAADETFVGAVFARVAEGDMSGIVMGARTGSPDARGGLYSLFYNGVPYGAATIESAWIYGLQQNDENRSNLALVNTGEVDGSEITLEIDIYDGEGESQPRTRKVVLGPRRWHQLNGILAGTSQGYVEVRKTLGDNPFIAYGVINDGGKPGQRSGDGAFLPSQ